MNPLNHVAIIMDGNGRWGLKHKKSRNLGHREGLKSVENVIDVCLQKKIKFLTLFTFSIDNWKRPKQEINYLFSLLQNFLKNKINDLNNKNIKLKFIGKRTKSKKLNLLIKKSETLTFLNDKLHINLALNYGSKEEITQTVKYLIKNQIKIKEKNISKNLFTKNIPDPDILIRTGNTKRLSNFLLWQLSYTEIFFIKKLWPDFKKKDFIKIIKDYKLIKRNYGTI